MEDDEEAWSQMLQVHIQEHIIPLFSSTSGHIQVHSCSVKDITLAVEKVLKDVSNKVCTQCGKNIIRHKLPSECDILSIVMLHERFTESFQAEIPRHSCDCTASQNKDDSELPSSCVQPGYNLLATLPSLVIGVLQPSSCGLALVDNTGSICCEVASAIHSLSLSHVGHLVVLVRWICIQSCNGPGKRNERRCHVEIEELVPIPLKISMTTLPQLKDSSQMYSVSRLINSIRMKQVPARANLCVYGRVRAISEVTRQNSTMLLYIGLEDHLHSHIQHCIVTQVPSLLYLSSILKIAEVYLFTNLRDKVLNKGSPKEKRVLVSTNDTQVHLYNPTTDLAGFVLPPPKKKAKVEDGSEQALDLTNSSSLHSERQCVRSGATELDRDNGSCSLTQGELSQDVFLSDPGRVGGEEGERLVSYEGTLTSCILPEAGVYEIDGRIRLYLTHQSCLNLCRGLRVGATVELYNVHVLKVTAVSFKRASGFYCCPVSSIRVARFSRLQTPFQGYKAENVLATVLKMYKAMDTAWLIECYLALRQRFGVKTCHTLLSHICCSLSLLPLNSIDSCSEFLTQPHHCLLLKKVDLSNRPLLPNLCELLEAIKVQIGGKDFKWMEGSGHDMPLSESSPLFVYAASTRWTFGLIKNSELHHNQFLVGELHGNSETGYMELVDGTARVPVACVLPIQTGSCTDTNTGPCHNILSGFGTAVMISKFNILVEKSDNFKRSSPTKSSKMQCYIHAKEVFASSPSKKKGPVYSSTPSAAGPSSKTGPLPIPRPYQTGSKEKSPSELIVEIINKNQVLTRTPTDTTSCKSFNFTSQALVAVKDSASQSRISVALTFPSTVFHLYPHINNGCVYELTLISPDLAGLPPLSTLVKEPCIYVTENMRFKYIKSSNLDSSPYIVLDVADVVSMTFLPSVPTVMDSNDSKDSMSRYENKLLSLRGTILKRECRIDHEALPIPVPSSVLTTTSSLILVFTVKSLNYPDSIMVYCKYRNGVTPPTVGLVPGGVATFNSFTLNTSKSGNIYFVSCASSSIVLNSLDGVEAYRETKSHKQLAPSGKSDITLDMIKLPMTYLSKLTQALVSGCLSRRVVCLRGRIVSVQRLSLQYKCLGCQCVIVNGQCMVACLQRRPCLTVEGRLIIDDGSGEGHVYASEGLLREMLMVQGQDWMCLCDLAMTIGTIVYNKPAKQFQSESTSLAGPSRLSPLDQAKNKLTDIATHHRLQRPIKLYCQPFVSQAELKECVLGQKSRTVRLKKLDQQYSTLVLPRLQLRPIAMLDLEGQSCVSECEKILELLSLSED